MRTLLLLLLLPCLLPAEQPDPVLSKVRFTIAQWRAALPDFICTQDSKMNRGNPAEGFRLSDSASYELRVIHGREFYFLKRSGGVELETRVPADFPGMNNRGEFASALLLLFDPSTQARFHRAGRETMEGRRLRRYDFSVLKRNSRWYVGPGDGYRPAYTGAFWADEADGNIYRLHMEAHKFPRKFPIQDVTLNVGFDTVRIEGDGYLMPVQSNVIVCGRLAGGCSRVYMRFTDYHRFTAASKVEFED